MPLSETSVNPNSGRSGRQLDTGQPDVESKRTTGASASPASTRRMAYLLRLSDAFIERSSPFSTSRLARQPFYR